jgi:channel protein (hemolysin III family)
MFTPHWSVMQPFYVVDALFGIAEPFSCMTHLLAAVVALVWGVRLVSRFEGSRLDRIGLGLFVFGMVNMFAMSAVFHLLELGGAPRSVLLLLDHAGIWLMIAGSLTPIQLMLCRGWRRWGVLGFVWSATIVGIVLKTVYFASVPEWLSLALYFAVGWVGGSAIFEMIRQVERRQWLLFVAGGSVYTVGAILDWQRIPVVVPGIVGPHEVFHICVMVGATCHAMVIGRLAAVTATRSGPHTGDDEVAPLSKDPQVEALRTQRPEIVA